jgi:hypothetical protein
MKTTLAVTLLILGSAASVSSAVVYGPITNAANGHLYYLLRTNTWTASETEAVALGGHLATINDVAENAWVFNTFAYFSGAERSLWIGLRDFDPSVNALGRAARRTEFGWASGEPVTYSDWSPLEPNNPGSLDPVPVPELFVHIWHPGDRNVGNWNNFVNDMQIHNHPINGVVEVVPDDRSVRLQATYIGDVLRISWPPWATGFTVQWSQHLPAVGWETLTNSVGTSASEFFVIDTVAPGPKFYRLAK